MHTARWSPAGIGAGWGVGVVPKSDGFRGASISIPGIRLGARRAEPDQKLWRSAEHTIHVQEGVGSETRAGGGESNGGTWHPCAHALNGSIAHAFEANKQDILGPEQGTCWFTGQSRINSYMFSKAWFLTTTKKF